MWFPLNVSRASNKTQCTDDIELWFIVLAFVQYSEWMDFVCMREIVWVFACVRAKDIECKQKHTEEQSYKPKWWHFSLCALGCCAVLSYAVCAACFKNRMCSIRDRNHIVCIILILFCGSCCSWLFRGMYVFVCLYFAIIDLHWIEYGIDVMRSDAVLLLLLLSLLLQFFYLWDFSCCYYYCCCYTKSHNNTENKSKDNQNNNQ